MADYSSIFDDPAMLAKVLASFETVKAQQDAGVLPASGVPASQPPQQPAQALIEAPPPVDAAAPVPQAAPVPTGQPAPLASNVQSAPVAPPVAPEQPVPVPVPVPEETPAPASVGPADMHVTAPVEAPTGSLGQQQRQVLGESVAAKSEVGESHAREGDIKSQEAAQAAKIHKEATKFADRYQRAAAQKYENHEARAAHYRQMEDEDFQRLRQEPPRPGNLKNIFNVITGIIGAAAGGTTGDALGMLRQHVNREAEQDAQERGLAMQRLGEAGKIRDNIMRDAANEFDASAKLVAGQWLVASRQLEQIASESNVPAFREQALRLSIDAKEQARGQLRQNIEAQIERERALEAARVKAARDAEQEQWNRRVQLQELAIKQQAADTDALGKGPKPVFGREVADPALQVAARPEDVAKFRDADAKMRTLGKTLDKLSANLKTHGTEVWGTEAETMTADAANALALIKDIKELGALDNGLLEFGEKLLGDPTAMWKSGASVRARLDATRAALQEELETKAESLGFTRRKYGNSIEEQATAFGAQERTPGPPVSSSPPIASSSGGPGSMD